MSDDQPKPPTADQRRKMNAVLRELEKGGAITACAKRAKVSERSVYTWRTRFPEFDTEVKAAMEIGADAAEQTLWDIATGKLQVKSMAQVTASFGILKARRPMIWAEKHQGVDPGKVIPVEVKFSFDPSPQAGSPVAMSKPRLKVVDGDGG